MYSFKRSLIFLLPIIIILALSSSLSAGLTTASIQELDMRHDSRPLLDMDMASPARADDRADDEIISSLPVHKVKKSASIFAVQILLLDCADMEEVEERVSDLKKSGVNTLIFRVFHNKGDRFYSFARVKAEEGVYFKSRKAPVVDDVLGDVARIARKNGMEIYAWMTTRYADYGVDDRVGWRAAGYDLESRSFKRIKGLNLFNRDVKNHIISIYRELSAYDIDGILFQDDLVLKHTEGFSREARKAFALKYNKSPDPTSFYRGVYRRGDGKYMVSSYGGDFWEWSRWKNRNLLGLAGEIMENVKKVKPEMKFAINLMYEAAIMPEDALAWLSQDLDEAVRMGFDQYAIMAYHRQISDELGLKGASLDEAMARIVRTTIAKVGDPEKVLIKLQIADWKNHNAVPYSEMERMVRIVRENGGKSLAFVPYNKNFDFRLISPTRQAFLY